jgi:predicted PurR-regulated permease PerM
MTIETSAYRPPRGWTRRTVSLTVPGVILLVLLLTAPDVPLVIFAGILLAVLNSACGNWIASTLRIRRSLGVGVFLLLVMGAFSGFVTAFVPAILEQADEFGDQAPAAIAALREVAADLPWLSRMLESFSPSALVSSENRAVAAGAVSSTLGALGNIVLVLFIGLFGALAGDTYRDGALSLLAPSLRPRARVVMADVAATVRSWLLAKLITMAAVGVLTWVGLWLIGVPLPLLMGFISGLLAFVPNLGPVIAAAPAMLLAVPSGGQTVLLVVVVFVVVQSLESYILTPVLQQRSVSLPPALVIGVQLMMGILFGLIGLVLATPLAAVAMTVIKATYVDDYLDHEERRD